MDHSFARPCLSTLLVLVAVHISRAQTPPQVAQPAVALEQSAGTPLLRDVAARIERHQTISAKVRHRANLFDQKLIGFGAYRQKQTVQGTQIRFSLSVKAGDRTVNLLHIGDGRFLWMHDNLDGRPKLSRIDLQRLRRAEIAQGAPTSMAFTGGLPRLLSSLLEDFRVARPSSVQYQGIPMWALSCTWDPERLVKIWPDAKRWLDEKGELRYDDLPEQVPDRIFLLVGQDDLFPYQIDFRRTTRKTGLGVLGESGDATRSLTTMDFYEVQFDAPLDPMLFAYRPSNIEVKDKTDDYLTRVKSGTLR